MFWLWTVNCIGGILGGIVLFVLMYQTRNNLNLFGYSQGLLQNSILDFIYAVLCLFIQPEVIVVNGTFISSTNFFEVALPPGISGVMSTLFPLIFTTICALSFLPFYVRYLTLCPCTKKGPKIFRAYCVSITISIIFNIFMGTAWIYDPEKSPECRSYKKTVNLGTTDDFRWFNFICSESNNLHFRISMYLAILIVTTNYFLIIFYNYKVLKFLKFETMVPEIKLAYRQLQTCMLLQCISSAVAIVLPLTIVTSAYLFGEKNSAGLTSYMSLLHSFVAIANPFLTIIAVKEYRARIYEWIQNFLDLVLT